jgi:hypothetical protein
MFFSSLSTDFLKDGIGAICGGKMYGKEKTSAPKKNPHPKIVTELIKRFQGRIIGSGTSPVSGTGWKTLQEVGGETWDLCNQKGEKDNENRNGASEILEKRFERFVSPVRKSELHKNGGGNAPSLFPSEYKNTIGGQERCETISGARKRKEPWKKSPYLSYKD